MRKLLSLGLTVAFALGITVLSAWSQEEPAPSIDVEKEVSADGVNWDDADELPGLRVLIGSEVHFRFVVTNTGNVELINITLTDNVLDTSGCVLTDPLPAGASFECLVGPLPGPAAFGEEHTNTATATGEYEGVAHEDTDDANYTGAYEACSPGFWKNHPDDWPEPYSPDDLVGDVFVEAPEGLAGNTLLRALKYKGGRRLMGAARILIRAAMAAVLNEAADVPGELWDYPFDGTDAIIGTADDPTTVNGALASGDRATMLALSEQLDAFNNGVCQPDEPDEEEEDEADEVQLAPSKVDTLTTTWGKIKER